MESSLSDAIQQLVPEQAPVAGGWDDVLQRAGAALAPAVPPTMANARPKPRGLRRRRLVMLCVVAAFCAAGAATAFAIQFRGPSPGFTAGISAFDRLPPIASVPASFPRAGFGRVASYAGLSPVEAERRLRKLRDGLSQGDLYAFEGSASGTVCVFIPRYLATCLNEENAPRYPGVLATVSPGYPGETAAVVAIVADNVHRVTLLRDGKAQELPIVNNSVYADLDGLSRGETLALEAVYADDSVKTFPLPNSKGQ